jgi:hypothetical protein
MADPAHISDHLRPLKPEALTMTAKPIATQFEGDEIIAYPRNRRLIIEAGKRARAEQEHLEREYGLQNGRTPRGRSETDPRGGVFFNRRRAGSLAGAISMCMHSNL